MSRLANLRQGLERAWESTADGWRELVDRASGALTRFRREPETPEPGRPAGRPGWGLMAADIENRGDSLLVRLEAPGMDRSDFEVTVEGRQLRIRGEKSAGREERSGRFYRVERAYGRFERLIPLPVQVDGAKARARYRRGVLEVEIPKTGRDRSVDVPVD